MNSSVTCMYIIFIVNVLKTWDICLGLTETVSHDY